MYDTLGVSGDLIVSYQQGTKHFGVSADGVPAVLNADKMAGFHSVAVSWQWILLASSADVRAFTPVSRLLNDTDLIHCQWRLKWLRYAMVVANGNEAFWSADVKGRAHKKNFEKRFAQAAEVLEDCMEEKRDSMVYRSVNAIQLIWENSERLRQADLLYPEIVS